MEKNESLTFTAIAAKILLIESLEEKVKQFESELNNLHEVSKPEFIEAIEEWNSYCGEVNQFFQTRSKISNDIKSTEVELEQIRNELKENIPVLIWFKIQVNNDHRWVGVKTSNWGGYTATLIIKKTRPEFALKHE